MSFLTPVKMNCCYTLLFGALVLASPWIEASDKSLREPLAYEILEEVPSLHVVGNIMNDFRLDGSIPTEDIPLLAFSLVHKEGQRHYFDIDGNGTLYSTETIDREQICPMEVQCSIHLDVEIMPIQYFQIIKVIVSIIDVNDNAPIFEQRVIHVSLSESIPIGSMIPLPMATDLDSPEHGISGYDLDLLPSQGRYPPDIFQLNTKENIQDLLGEIYIVIQEHLDYEDIQQYLLRVTAFDSATPRPHEAILLVNITVSDINDNAPVFRQTLYTVDIPENAPNDSFVVQVTADDTDAGHHGIISYSFSKRTSELYGDHFRIDSDSGEVFVKQSLDYEHTTDYTLVVIAADRSTSSLTSETIISITVMDVNDIYPRITVTPLGSNTTNIQVIENSPPNIPLAHISVHDPDSGLGGAVQCALNTSGFLLSQIYANDFMLQATHRLDHEREPSVHLALRCSDGGYPELSTEYVVVVVITDVNDNAPVFTSNIYQVNLSGHLTPGDRISHIQATDRDSGNNGKLKYSFKDQKFITNLFRINASSGEVFAKVHLPMFAIKDLRIEITAEDGGNPVLSADASIVISSSIDTQCYTVPRNKSRSSDRTMLPVTENTPSGANIHRLPRDPSCRATSAIYPLSVRNVIYIDTAGNIKMSGTVDRERASCYLLAVITKHECRSRNNVDIKQFTLLVEDVNDNAPVILYPSTSNHSFIVNSGHLSDKPIAKIIATDADIGNNAQLIYKIQNAWRYNYLRLNADSGELYMTGAMPEDIMAVRLVVIVSDRGDTSLNSTVSFWITKNETEIQNAPIVASDSLAKVMGAAVPCGFLLVVFVVLAVVLIRRKIRSRSHQKGKRNHINPFVDIKIKLAQSGSVTPEDQLQTICKQLGLEIQKEKDLYQKDNYGYDPSDIAVTKDVDIAEVHMETKIPVARVSSSIHGAPSSRDSDSGCSADMSHSTTDSWTNTNNTLLHHQPRPIPNKPIPTHSTTREATKEGTHTRFASSQHVVRPAHGKPNEHYCTGDALDYVRLKESHSNLHENNNLCPEYRSDSQAEQTSIRHHVCDYININNPIQEIRNVSYIDPDKVKRYGHIHDSCQADLVGPNIHKRSDVNPPERARCNSYHPPSTSEDTKDLNGRLKTSLDNFTHGASVHRSMSYSASIRHEPTSPTHSHSMNIHNSQAVNRSRSYHEGSTNNSAMLTTQTDNGHPKPRRVFYEVHV